MTALSVTEVAVGIDMMTVGCWTVVWDLLVLGICFTRGTRGQKRFHDFWISCKYVSYEAFIQKDRLRITTIGAEKVVCTLEAKHASATS